MTAGPKWLSLIGPHGSAEVDRLTAIQSRARTAGLSVRWQRVGNKWTGKSGFKFGHIEVLRAREVVDHVDVVISTPWADGADGASTAWIVKRALDELDRLVAKQEAQDVEVAS